ncbi:PadR family transcriptional regulator [Streptomyces sp. SL13]|uniref:PadR family transcriptional regulator n=1 Tax=Streptantibioticus silvisoli TaxID=2705255 RepID=A0AA90HG85_9ACTN|nr:PadR family transcriptional regulator [Streptantibioticus silvisoli]MDI5974377.1 PadR family transcriptional regulator [Streptantibioticus silvisoli]
MSLLRSGPRYGTELLAASAETGALATSQGTAYPLLARLRREELVTTDRIESPNGPPRRFCTLTPQGRAALEDFSSVRAEFTDAVDRVLALDRPHLRGER